MILAANHVTDICGPSEPAGTVKIQRNHCTNCNAPFKELSRSLSSSSPSQILTTRFDWLGDSLNAFKAHAPIGLDYAGSQQLRSPFQHGTRRELATRRLPPCYDCSPRCI